MFRLGWASCYFVSGSTSISHKLPKSILRPHEIELGLGGLVITLNALTPGNQASQAS